MRFNATTIDHRGEPVHLPFIVYQATSVNIYSLLDYEAACRLCEGEKYQPIIIRTQDGGKRAAGVVAALDYQKTSLCPYHEWSLGIFVSPRAPQVPEIKYINETSLFFQSILDDVLIGNIVYCPKLVLDEALPTEIGFEHYGLPKELGRVEYNHARQVSDFSVTGKEGPWIMKASFPTRGGASARIRLLGSLFKAYGFRLLLRSLGKKEFLVTLAGSAKILARNALMEIRNDPKTEMFPWRKHDCHIEINPASEWGKVLLELNLQPMLVCHVPNLQFKFSEPLEQE